MCITGSVGRGGDNLAGDARVVRATRGLNRLADADDLEAVTRRINGGLNGLDHRRELLLRAKGLLMP